MISMDELRNRLSESTDYSPPAAPVMTPPSDLSPLAQYQLIQDSSSSEIKARREAARTEYQADMWKNFIEKTGASEVRERVSRVFESTRESVGTDNKGGHMIVQLSDLHFGAKINRQDDFRPNNYDIEVACHRLSAFADQVLFYAAAHDCKHVTIALTGDIYDSSVGKEMADKIRHNEGTGCASFLRGHDMVVQFVDRLAHSGQFESIDVNGICGNEGRLTKEIGYGENMRSENWDGLLNGFLSRHWDYVKPPIPITVTSKPHTHVLEVLGWRVLMTHGDSKLGPHLDQKACQATLGQYHADWGISGHHHDPHVTGLWSRSGSLVGSCHFSADGVGYKSNAFQTIYWLSPKTETTGVKQCYVIDLQSPSLNHVPFIDTQKIDNYGGAFGHPDD